VRVAGVQVRVAPGDTIRLPRLNHEVGSTTTLGEVLLVSDGETTTVGTPVVEGVRVEAEILGHARDKKVIVFKKKRRKRYRRTNGHRQPYTAVKITEIVLPEQPDRKASARKMAATAAEDTAQEQLPAEEGANPVDQTARPAE
jgi:large subunit ribosomal protein L21